MIRINENYLKLHSSYLFSDIAKRVATFSKANPTVEIISMGIGDVTRPLPQACINAFHRAVDELSRHETFRGYGPEQGYQFLRGKIATEDFQARNAEVYADEIFISDGAKCDCANIQELFSQEIKVAIPDPVYPVYVDTNVMAGRTAEYQNGRYKGIEYLECTKQNNFIPQLPSQKVDLIYLCFPNNPTGATITKEELSRWVDYARQNKALILFDAAYEAYIRKDDIPHSIYEINGAREVAIEFRSFSKTAGFTGTRCAYTVVPKECIGYTSNGEKQPLHALWNRRHTTKFNGVSYPVQRAAEAIYSEEGKTQVTQLCDYYLRNARLIRQNMSALGYSCTGGENSPYIWVDTKIDSWEFFNFLLEKAGVVCTPGSGFGKCGEGYVRLSGYNSYENTLKAMEKITKILT